MTENAVSHNATFANEDGIINQKIVFSPLPWSDFRGGRSLPVYFNSEKVFNRGINSNGGLSNGENE